MHFRYSYYLIGISQISWCRSRTDHESRLELKLTRCWTKYWLRMAANAPPVCVGLQCYRFASTASPYGKWHQWLPHLRIANKYHGRTVCLIVSHSWTGTYLCSRLCHWLQCSGRCIGIRPEVAARQRYRRRFVWHLVVYFVNLLIHFNSRSSLVPSRNAKL